MHSFQNFIVRLIPNHPPPLETRIWKLVVRALLIIYIFQNIYLVSLFIAMMSYTMHKLYRHLA